VFAGGWTLQAAEAVCAVQGDLNVVEGLSSLLDKSLVQQEEMPDDEPRFRMLEVIREYAWEQLEALGAKRVLGCRHAEYYLALAREAEANQWGPEQAQWLRRLSRDLDNLRAALAWSRDNGEVELALQLGGALMWFWHDAGRWTEARVWLESALAVAGPDHRTEGRVAALNALGVCRWCLGDFEVARAEAEEQLAICRELGDRRGMGHALHGLGVLAAEQGDLTGARALIEEGLSYSRAVGDDRFVGLALHNLATYALHENDEVTARARIEESRRVWQELGSTECLSMASTFLGDLAWSTGEYVEAAAHYRESLELLGEAGPRGWRSGTLQKLGHATRRLGDDREARALFTEALLLCRELDDRRGVVEAVAGLACLAAKEEPERTVRLMGAIAAATEAMGPHLNLSHRTEYDQILAGARRQLGHDAFDAAWTQGQALTLEQAIVDALADHPGPGSRMNIQVVK
jgi:tetratricopeptide (TPR) repeat protein